MEDIGFGINEEELSNLSLEVIDHADNISEIFDRIDACMEKLPIHYQGTPCTELINFYNKLTPFYEIIKNNIISYSDDLIELIKKMQENDKIGAGMIQIFTNETINKMKSVKK